MPLIRENAPVPAPWLTSVTPVGPPSSANPRVRFLLYAGLVTGIWSGLLSLLVYGIGRATGVPFAAASLDGVPKPITWLAVLLFPIAAGEVFALLGALLRGRRHAGRITWWIGTVVAALSMLGPLLQPSSVDWGTRILLVVMHIITWFLVVPQIARIVGDSEPGRSVPRAAL